MIDQKARSQFKKYVLDKFKIESYQDIHEAIDALRGLFSNKLKGDLFETFVHGMLMTDPRLRIKYSFKPGDDGPNDALRQEAIKKLGIKDKDDGIDLVMIDKDDRIITVQDKYLSNTLAAVTYGEVTNFYTQSQFADIQYLVTSGSKIDGSNKDPKHKEQNRIKFTFDDLKSLSKERISQIVDFIKTETYTKQMRKAPRPDQARAINNLKDGFSKSGRIQYISACGTGKTFVSSRLANETVEREGEVVVFVPSINLMKQTIEAWAVEFSDRENYSFQAICSDDSVTGNVIQNRNDDEPVDLSVDDLKCATTTNVEEIRKFINRPLKKGELKVTFCTYQSSPVLSEAVKETAFKGFNLGILDEAHRTAVQGDKSAVNESVFTYPLHDDKIPILQRLSMTATPRVLKLKNRDDEDDSYTYSMDNEDIYGPVAHEYKFSEAVADKVIVPFKIVISAVLEEDIKLFQNARVQAGKFELDAKSAVAAVALKKAIEDTGARNVVTYQSRTKDAANLARIMSEVMPDNWNTDFVDGKMPAKQRSQKVAILGQKNPAIITNSRVMTEGVDIPDIDMAAFIDNMTSGVDIVQITGRVMRTAANKDVGYVVLPVAVNRKPGQTIEDATEEADFSMIYRVINALTSEDEDLMTVINEVRSARGSGDVSRQRFASEELRKRISFSFSANKNTNDYHMTSDAIARVVETKVVDRISSSFWHRFGEIKRYLFNNGGIFPSRNDKDVAFSDGVLIWQWLSNQKNLYRCGKLSQDRIDALEGLGISWNRFEDTFYFKLSEFEAYVRMNDGKVPNQKDRTAKFTDGTYIGVWVYNQKRDFSRGIISKERVELLEAAGIDLHAREDNFSARIAELKCFMLDNDGRPPRKRSRFETFSDGVKMSVWVANQKRIYMSGKMSAERVNMLKDAGINWASSEDTFAQKILELQQILKNTGGVFPSKSDKDTSFSDGVLVGVWINNKRQEYRNGKLSYERVNELNRLGMNWNVKTDLFPAKVVELSLYLKKNNGVFPQQKDRSAKFSDDVLIGQWLTIQRQYYRKGLISPERIAMLEELGFEWSPKDDVFMRQIAELKIYLQKNNWVFPLANDKDATFSDGVLMGQWLSNRRSWYKEGRLPCDKINALNDLGIDWTPRKNRKTKQIRVDDSVSLGM